MRTALLAAVQRDDDGALRALKPLAGRSVLGWQIDIARRHGCERIACLCEDASPEILALQREVESDGAEFHLVRSNAQLVALLHQGEQVLMLLDGLIVHPSKALPITERQGKLAPVILAIPFDAETTPRAGTDFERIDAERSWAGVAVIEARIVHKLADYPPDSVPMSLLMRLALQDGVPWELADSAGDAGFLPVLATSDDFVSRQKALVTEAAPPIDATAPGLAAANLLARSAVLSGKDIPRWSRIVAAGLAITIAALLFWLREDGSALIMSAIAIFGIQLSGSMGRLKRKLKAVGSRKTASRTAAISTDLIAIFALIAALDPLASRPEKLALALFAVGLARIAAPKSAFWTDRATHMLGFAAASFTGTLAPILALFGLGAMAHTLLRGPRD